MTELERRPYRNEHPINLSEVVSETMFLLDRNFADIAQLEERLFCNQEVRGSIPLIGTIIVSSPELRVFIWLSR